MELETSLEVRSSFLHVTGRPTAAVQHRSPPLVLWELCLTADLKPRFRCAIPSTKHMGFCELPAIWQLFGLNEMERGHGHNHRHNQS